MDIAKYIGLYLLKNNFCYIHGLGNLVVKKQSASFDGQKLDAPTYQVHMTTGGSIDDAVANFIATHEQTSISKAANNLREFSIQSRADLSAGKEIVIPAIGKFVSRDGKIEFITDPHIQYTPPSIPALKTASRLADVPTFKTNVTGTSKGVERYDEDQAPSGSTINWGRVILVLAILGVMLAGGIFGYRYYANQDKNNPVSANTTIAPVPDLIPPVAVDGLATNIDSTTVAGGATTANSTATGANYKVILNTYTTAAAAERRASTLKSNGSTVAVVSKDENTYHVVMVIENAQGDRTNMVDSLRRFFNPTGDVRILD